MGKVFTMTTGELNYDGYGDLPFNWLNYFLYCTFVILMPIVFMNLLTSLKMTEIEKNAKFNLVKLQVKATHAIQEWLPERFIESSNVFMFQQFLSIVRDFLFSEYRYIHWIEDEWDGHYSWAEQSYLKSSDNQAGSSKSLTQGSKIKKFLSRLG